MENLFKFKDFTLDFTENIYGGANDNETSSQSQCTTENNDCKQVDCTDTCDRDDLACTESTC